MHGPTSPAWYVPETPCGYVSMQLSERGNVKSSGVSEIGSMLASFSEQVDRTGRDGAAAPQTNGEISQI